MDYFFSEQQQMMRSLVRRIAEEKVLPVRAELDEKEEFPWAIMKELADVDMFRIFIPEEYGGLGGGCLDLCLIIEELSRVCSGVAISYAATAPGCYPILSYGTSEQKQRYLPDIAAGKRLAAFAITEPEAGSDVGAIQTSAVREKDSYVLNGTKQFITNGGEAEIYTVIAITDPAERMASAFVVEQGAPGFIDTEMTRKLSESLRSGIVKQIPIGYLGLPEDVAQAVVFLASEEARYITGQVLNVDGGMVMV